jgi:hypothetical protein
MLKVNFKRSEKSRFSPLSGEVLQRQKVKEQVHSEGIKVSSPKATGSSNKKESFLFYAVDFASLWKFFSKI